MSRIPRIRSSALLPLHFNADHDQGTKKWNRKPPKQGALRVRTPVYVETRCYTGRQLGKPASAQPHNQQYFTLIQPNYSVVLSHRNVESI